MNGISDLIKADLFLVFWGTSTLFSIVAVPTYIPTNSVGGSLFFTPSPAFVICRLFNDGHSDQGEGNRFIGIENRLVVAKGEWGGRGMDWEFGVGRCKLLHLEWIYKKVLMSSTGNIQYPVINRNGKEYLKKNVYMCVTESLFCTAEIWHSAVNQLYFS